MNKSRSELPIGLSDAERVGAGLAAAALFSFGSTQRAFPRLLWTIAAMPLAYRAAVGHWPSLEAPSEDTRDALAGPGGLHVREAVRIETPVDELYQLWRAFDNLPKFMRHLRSVESIGDQRTHWTANGPAGLKVEWDAEIVNDVANEIIAWQSLPGSEVISAGSVTFKPVRGGDSTQLSVHLQYSAPAGSIGSYAAMLMGREPSQMIREDLRRLKQICESGEIPHAVPPEQEGLY